MVAEVEWVPVVVAEAVEVRAGAGAVVVEALLTVVAGAVGLEVKEEQAEEFEVEVASEVETEVMAGEVEA